MEKISAVDLRLEEMFDNLAAEIPPAEIIGSWTDYPDTDAAANFLIIRMETFKKSLGDSSAGLSGQQTDSEDISAMLNEHVRIGNAVGILAALDKPRAVIVTAGLLAVCLECEYNIVFPKCVEAMIEFGPAALNETVKRYEFYRPFPQYRGVWLEILAKLGISTPEIRSIIEDHLKLNQYEAVLAMGDCRDGYFIPVLKDIVNTVSARLKKNRIDPFEKNVRVWNRDADIYIEARSVLVELEYGTTVDSPLYESMIMELDARLLPHADHESRRLNRLGIKDSLKRQLNGNNPGDRLIGADSINIHEDYLFKCLLRALHDLPQVKEIPYVLGYLRAAAAAGQTRQSGLLQRICGKPEIFDDEKHLQDTADTLLAIQNYYRRCFESNRPGNRIWKNQDDELLDKHLRAQSLCQEISGCIDGIDAVFRNVEDNVRKNAAGPYASLHDIHDGLNSILRQKYDGRFNHISSKDDLQLDRLENEFHNYTLNVAQTLRG